MLELTPDTIARAAQRTREHHPRVSRISDTEIAVSCANPDHPGGHVARFERRADGSLWGECVLRETGELCPAAIGRRVCYHLTAGAPLYLWVEEMRAREDWDGQTETAVLLDGALPRPATRNVVNFPRVTERVSRTLGGAVVLDRRMGGIQF